MPPPSSRTPTWKPPHPLPNLSYADGGNGTVAVSGTIEARTRRRSHRVRRPRRAGPNRYGRPPTAQHRQRHPGRRRELVAARTGGLSMSRACPRTCSRPSAGRPGRHRRQRVRQRSDVALTAGRSRHPVTAKTTFWTSPTLEACSDDRAHETARGRPVAVAAPVSHALTAPRTPSLHRAGCPASFPRLPTNHLSCHRGAFHEPIRRPGRCRLGRGTSRRPERRPGRGRRGHHRLRQGPHPRSRQAALEAGPAGSGAPRLRGKQGFEQLLSSRGIGTDDTIVLYGGNNNWFAPTRTGTSRCTATKPSSCSTAAARGGSSTPASLSTTPSSVPRRRTPPVIPT